MAVSRIDILNQTFHRAVRGYNVQEVDALLQEVADTLGRMSEERAALEKRVAQLEGRVAEYQEREGALRDTLLATQRMVESAKGTAQREAALIVRAAQNRAETILAQAQDRLLQIQESILEARKLKTQFRLQMRSTLEMHLKMLEMSNAEDAELEAALARLKQKDAKKEQPAKREA